jgi:hypothetical protein
MTVPQEIFEASPSYPPETNENTRIVQELTPSMLCLVEVVAEARMGLTVTMILFAQMSRKRSTHCVTTFTTMQH